MDVASAALKNTETQYLCFVEQNIRGGQKIDIVSVSNCL